ncbi:hypothetical protein IAQ61_011825 [Plenodomus lingam]|uniref:uncharacterized protein n=1 Tax=Leptosphaeria maculans TaxID=5022 RepID=UPI003316E7D5|nr:hypothetical protein IAQ61_011825 [Plenodomus lingam]
MSETHRQQAFGMPTFIDASASGNLSGPDQFDLLDANDFFNNGSRSSHAFSLHLPSHEGYPQGQHTPYASHSSSMSLSGKFQSLLDFSLDIFPCLVTIAADEILVRTCYPVVSHSWPRCPLPWVAA